MAESVKVDSVEVEIDTKDDDDRTKTMNPNSYDKTPEERAWFPSRATVSWLNPLFSQGYKEPLQMEDLMYLKNKDTAASTLEKFNVAWDRSKQAVAHDVNPSMYKVLRSAFGRKMFTAFPYYVIYQIAQFASPVLLSMYLEAIGEEDKDYERLCIIAALLFGSFMLGTFIVIHYWAKVFTVGMNSRGALIAACYEKALKLTLSARGERTTGQIINLITSDCRKVRDLPQYLWVVVMAPMQIILAMYLIYAQIGWSVFVAIGTQIIIVVPIQLKIVGKARVLQAKMAKIKDKRLKLVNELFGAMKIVKMYGWEQSFQNNVGEIRGEEMNILTSYMWWAFGITLFFLLAPTLIIIISFGFYTLVDGKELTATKAFTSMALFNILRFPLAMLPNVIVSIIDASVSFRRLSGFLSAAEIDPYIIEYSTNNDDNDNEKKNAITVRTAKFAWDDAMEIVALSNINVDFKQGDITMIIGETGSGKSTLLAAILGQINKIDGSLQYYDDISVAFSSQVAWIQNATVRENILFGRDYDSEWYAKVTFACALLSDFEQFDNGDLTEIGERGINLSGGQKQRISLARAVYTNADVMIFDDPLSAVDPHVGNHIFNECFIKLLKQNGKTIILSTHAVSFLKQADKILVMEGCTIKLQGSLQNLIDAKVNLTEFIIEAGDKNNNKDVEEEEEEEQAGGGDTISPLAKSKSDEPPTPKRRRSSAGFALEKKASEKKIVAKSPKKKDGHLMEAEERGEGDISFNTLKLYFFKISCCAILTLFLTAFIGQAFNSASQFWLAWWADDEFDQDILFYIGVFFGIQFVVIIFTFVQQIFVISIRIQASKNLHDSLLVKCIHAPMKFFDTTPIGRIINRFSKDINAIDNDIPNGFVMFMRFSLMIIGVGISVVVVSWYFVLASIPLGYLYWKLQKYFIATTRELRRLSALQNSPIYSHFGETLDGINVIHAFKKTDSFCAHNKELIDADHQTYYPSYMANRWLSVRLESIANIGVGVAAFGTIFTAQSAGFAGVALSSIMNITGLLNFFVRIKSQLEQDAVSIERVAQYNEIVQEAPHKIEETKPAETWPANGKIEINEVYMRYREGLEHVLRGLTVTIEGGQKVGVIGRTGAGKSSLFVTLLRICEYDQGMIKIDDVDIKRMGLYHLRSRISVIPQDPVLFIGTVRKNLDPFGTATDEQLIEACKLSHVYDGLRKMAIEADMKREQKEAKAAKRAKKEKRRLKIAKQRMKQTKDTKAHAGGEAHQYDDRDSSASSSTRESSTGSISRNAMDFIDDPKYKDLNILDIIVDENGSNFSVGQRQLLCLARAIIRKSKILLLDEATSAVDHHTDQLIQETIRKVFAKDTILTIAHRIDTVLDYDKIMIMDKGKILEFDSPNNLLNDKESKFRDIVTESFGVNVEEVIQSKSYLSSNANAEVQLQNVNLENVNLEIDDEKSKDVTPAPQDNDQEDEPLTAAYNLVEKQEEEVEVEEDQQDDDNEKEDAADDGYVKVDVDDKDDKE